MSTIFNIGCVCTFQGAPDAVTDYLWCLDNLQRHIPHVKSVTQLTSSRGTHQQLFRMQLAPPGAQACDVITLRHREHRRIRYRQIQPHPLLRSHAGEWLICGHPSGAGAIVYLNHELGLDDDRVALAKPAATDGTSWALDLVRQSGNRSLEALSAAFAARVDGLASHG